MVVGPRRRRSAELVVALLAVCALGGPALAEEEPTVRVHVVSNGWHAGLVLPLDESVFQACPPLEDFRGHRSVELGWGDEGFYRADPVTFGTAFRAVFWPTPTVLHVVALDREVTREYTTSDVVALDLPATDFQRMIRRIAATFDGHENLGEGLYGRQSFFYRAHGSYYFPNTCNVWLLRLLEDAGVPLSPLLGTRGSSAMAQVAAQGTVLRMEPPEVRWPYGLAWLAGLALGFGCQRRAHRRQRRSFLAGPLWVAWVLAALGSCTALGCLLAAANLPGSLAVAAGLRGGIALMCLALGLGMWVAGRRLARRRRLRELATASLSALWIFLVLAGA